MTEEHERLWEIISDMPACMVTTQDGDVMRARPMATFIDKDARTIRFVTDNGSAKLSELADDHDLCLTFADTKSMLYASVSGKGKVSRDRDLIRKLWGPYCDVFFPGGADEADVAVITVVPTQAEYWDNDKNSVAMAYEMVKAYFSDDGPDLGGNAKLSM
ncbi:pyridoxamine 5'-phosphate oxidase family protein [Sulfitobacter sp. S190]|uniref:pyridoxamine 5'-phosphate oxidase family protein n=1 Tax=Sulfitobacter sp. S190 TaxID=2867022 RepID=UPI0021A95600|nr:pyridoxamine 5'-phosphate oxidase family protein [Sulfitobacter sp. S190]UWR24455.1 pyridoxamine 5'-phosphate oxidase family protein [Sulfitobacter sp. S190]